MTRQKREPLTPIKCSCGVTFRPYHGKQKFCKPCSFEVERAKKSELAKSRRSAGIKSVPNGVKRGKIRDVSRTEIAAPDRREVVWSNPQDYEAFQ